jgi:hypothetical protein
MSRQMVPPPRARTASMACWMVAVPALCSAGCTQTVQSQLSPVIWGGQKTRQSVSVSGRVTTASRA